MALTHKIGIVGGGHFGLALAYRLEQTGCRVMVYSSDKSLVDSFKDHKGVSSRHPELVFGKDVDMTTSPEDFCAQSQFVILATSSSRVVDHIEKCSPYLKGSHMVCHAIGGLAGESGKTISKWVGEHTAVRRVGVLAGPAFAGDLTNGIVASMVCASEFKEVCDAARELLNNPPALRIYKSSDLIGVEWASALAGAYTVALAVADELEVARGPRALLMTRILSEMSRLVKAVGGASETSRGLAGLGNLLVRGDRKEGDWAPSYRFGIELAKGNVTKDSKPPEGGRAVLAGVELAKKHRVPAPILGGLKTSMTGKRDVKSVATSMLRLVADTE